MKRDFFYFLFCLSLLSHVSHSQNSTKDFIPDETQKDWSFFVAPYVLFAFQATDVGGEKLRQSFNDLTSLTNSGFQIYGGVNYKKWTTSVDVTFADLGFDESSNLINVDLSIIQTIIDVRLGYTAYENFEFDETEVIKGWSFEVNAGAKYWRNDLGVNYSLVVGDTTIADGGIDENQRFWDLMLGVRFKFILSKKVLLGVSGSAGGFGIGASNDFSYDFTYSNSFLVSDLIMINAGFRNFRYDRTDGVGADELKTTVNVLGPLLGVMFRL